MSPLLLVAAAGGLALVLVAASRPAIACVLLAAAIPLTAGLGRGTVLPVLRVNEALLLLVVGGVLLGRLPRRRPLMFNGLDVAVLAFCAGGVLIPWAVLTLSHAPADLTDWMTVLAPVQYLMVYLLFSRVEFSAAHLRLLLNAVMLVSIPIGLIALAQLLDLGGIRTILDNYYPIQAMPSWDTVYRPASLLGFYSAVGAFGLLNFLLALALAATRHPGFPQLWLTLVMAVNVVGVLASQTYAPIVALPIGAVAVLLVARQVPWRQLAAAPPGLAVSTILLWPIIGNRVQLQLAGGGGVGLRLPESIAVRIDYWQGFFMPALLKHGLWLGTGTLIPSEVPRPLITFVDNGYLWQAFRAGLPGLGLYLLLLAAVAVTAWKMRSATSPSQRALGAVCLGVVASVVLLDTTSEYLLMTAVSQEFWMLAGLMTCLIVAARPSPASVVEVGWPTPAWWERPAAVARRIAPEKVLVRSSLSVLAGYGIARLLGFAFQVAAGHLLLPSDYGRLTYALAVATVASVLLSTAPLGLSRFLARHADSRPEQEAYFSNWLAVIALICLVSVVATVLVAPAIGLGGWMTVGLLANLLGTGALVTYLEVQRGVGRFTMQSAFWVVANVLQLGTVLTLAALHRGSPEVFLIVYGLSAVAALVFFLPLTKHGPGLALAALRWTRVKGILSFLRPILVQSVFWNLWYSGDLIMLQHLSGSTATGIYGAAKAIATGFGIIAAAVAYVFVPRVARLPESQIRGYLVRVLVFTVSMMAPAAAAVVFVAGPLTVALFGERYAQATTPMILLTLGMALFGLKNVLSGLWLGIGHPVVETVSTAAGMVATLVAGLLLIPSHGAIGAALAFGSGAAAQLLVEAGITVWAFGPRTPRVKHLGDGPVISMDPVARIANEVDLPTTSEPAPLLFFAEEAGAAPEGEYRRFVGKLSNVLEAQRPLNRQLTGARGGGWDPLGPLRRLNGLLRAARSDDRGRRPPAVIHVSRDAITVLTLLRSRLLKLLSGGAPVAMVAPKGCSIESGGLLRRLGPDLLLLPTRDEADGMCRAGVNAVHLWPPGGPSSWPMAGDRLLRLLDDLVLLNTAPPQRSWAWLAALVAQVRRSYVARRDWARRWRWGDEVAYQVRDSRALSVQRVTPAAAPAELVTSRSDVLGLIVTEAEGALAATAQLAGITLATAVPRAASHLVDRVFKERWSLLHLRAEDLEALPESEWALMATYLQAGGTLHVDGLRPVWEGQLTRVCRLLKVPAPRLVETAPMGSLSFPSERADFARELAGTRLVSPAGRTGLSDADGWEALAHGEAGERRTPVMVRRRLGRGALFLSTAPSDLEGNLAGAFNAGSPDGMAAVLTLMVVRAVYGIAAWHAPAVLANFTIDDPALRRGLLGPRWDVLLGRARDHEFHVTIATVPRELPLADAAVVELMRRHRGLLSACYHGCDHDSYEFYAPDVAHTRYRPRPLHDQRQALERAVGFGRWFTGVHDFELDRVMVFPHGIGPSELFGDLQRLGFVASCNFGDKYPLGSETPTDPDLGLRPADLAWAGFPLLWRRGVDDGGHLIDLLLSRPSLSFAHMPFLGPDLSPFVDLADRLNQATRGAATWCSLDEVARHAYLQRRAPDGTWGVLMTTNEACLHNPDPEPRTVTVWRPYLPPGAVFVVDGERVFDAPTLTVPAGGTSVVRVAMAGVASALRARSGCSIHSR